MDGSSTLLDMDSLVELSLYYRTINALILAGFYVHSDDSTQATNVRVSWVDNEDIIVPSRLSVTDANKQVPLPIVTLEASGTAEDPYQLGGDEGMLVYNPVFLIYARSKIELNQLTSFIRNQLDQRTIPIRNYNLGLPSLPSHDSTTEIMVLSDTGSAISSKSVDPTASNFIDRYIGTVSTTMEVLRTR